MHVTWLWIKRESGFGDSQCVTWPRRTWLTLRFPVAHLLHIREVVINWSFNQLQFYYSQLCYLSINAMFWVEFNFMGWKAEAKLGTHPYSLPVSPSPPPPPPNKSLQNFTHNFFFFFFLSFTFLHNNEFS